MQHLILVIGNTIYWVIEPYWANFIRHLGIMMIEYILSLVKIHGLLLLFLLLSTTSKSEVYFLPNPFQSFEQDRMVLGLKICISIFLPIKNSILCFNLIHCPIYFLLIKNSILCFNLIHCPIYFLLIKNSILCFFNLIHCPIYLFPINNSITSFLLPKKNVTKSVRAYVVSKKCWA
jgi:hypothetical protein